LTVINDQKNMDWVTVSAEFTKSWKLPKIRAIIRIQFPAEIISAHLKMKALNPKVSIFKKWHGSGRYSQCTLQTLLNEGRTCTDNNCSVCGILTTGLKKGNDGQVWTARHSQRSDSYTGHHQNSLKAIFQVDVIEQRITEAAGVAEGAAFPRFLVLYEV
jgi:hypothetical protein